MTYLAIHAAALLAIAATAQKTNRDLADPGFNKLTFKGLELHTIGPVPMSGRIVDIAINPTDQSS